MNNPLSVERALRRGVQQLKKKYSTEEATLEANLLLAHALKKNRSWLFAWPEKTLSTQESEQFQLFIHRRAQGEPISYITGLREFWGLPLHVDQHTLIPRHDTELLIETTLEIFPSMNAIQVLELGTGSGAIAAALSTERPSWQILATDNSPLTLQTAHKNLMPFSPQVTTQLSNWFEQIKPADYDLIISNPPYINENDPHLLKGDLRFEPKNALISGPDGLSDIRIIIQKSISFLQKKQGYLMLEHGFDQATRVRELLSAHGFKTIKTLKDLSGQERITLGQRSNTEN